MWNTSISKLEMSLETKEFCLVVIIVITIGITHAYYTSNTIIYAQETRSEIVASNDTNALIVMVNIERIRNQILLVEKSISNADIDIAFAHSYIPHSVIFPSVKNELNEFDAQSVSRLESLLTDLPITIKTSEKTQLQRSLYSNLREIEDLLDSISKQAIGKDILSNKTVVAQTAVSLLKDANQSYQLSNAAVELTDEAQTHSRKLSKVDYENSQGLVKLSKLNYEKITGFLDERRRQEIDSFFQQLENSMMQKANTQSISQLISAIERDLAEGLLLDSSSQNINGQSRYFNSIRDLLSNVVKVVKENQDYKKANQYAMTAYLDNFEYLEAPIEKYDPKLMADIEVQMREELRKILKQKAAPNQIETFVNAILTKLDNAQMLLEDDPSFNQQSSNLKVNGRQGERKIFSDIEGLKKGFGTYTGERRAIGDTIDSAKSSVRINIDQIRIKLDETVRLYKEGKIDQALTTSRSAYLDSYENVEIPLRPIDPDFTLEMEIKFAELRSLIQNGADYEQVINKAAQIRNGLDESERLVSGTGVLAPTIAFSTSFSLIFREGLESALIIGAILTYLEASRNERFKKHVYYGIIIAVAATAVTWFVAQYIIQISGASRELIEAIAGVSAVAVLFWVSFWVLNKVETKKWVEFVKAKVWKATMTGSLMVFVMLSFFTVYREGFETVLFYQAMLSFAKYMEWYVLAGLIMGLAIIIGVVLLIRRIGKKLPLRVLFGLTMGIGAYMSIAFIGNAIREFQEVGYISTTQLIGIIPRLDINLATMTGIHPTLETLLSQLLLLSIYIAGSLYILIIQPKKKQIIEASRKSMADLEKKRSSSDSHE